MSRCKTISVAFPMAGRNGKLSKVPCGKAPVDFFYGSIDLNGSSESVEFIDSREQSRGAMERGAALVDQAFNRLAGLPFVGFLVYFQMIKRSFSADDRVVSFTDSFSLKLAFCHLLGMKNVRFILGFHALTDLMRKSRLPIPIAAWLLKTVFGKNDRTEFFFFGDLDHRYCRRMLNLSRSSVFRFGVDTRFWRKSEGVNRLDFLKLPEDFILAVGSDPCRDYNLLLSSCTKPLVVLTSLPLQTGCKPNVMVIDGSLHGAALTDEQLRELYWLAKMVVVPIKNVVQPSGYSVALQAMACGKPLILTRFRGLWRRSLFKSGINCLLVNHSDEIELKKAVDTLWSDKLLAERLGTEARKTVEKYFSESELRSEFQRLIRHNNQ